MLMGINPLATIFRGDITRHIHPPIEGCLIIRLLVGKVSEIIRMISRFSMRMLQRMNMVIDLKDTNSSVAPSLWTLKHEAGCSTSPRKC